MSEPKYEVTKIADGVYAVEIRDLDDSTVVVQESFSSEQEPSIGLGSSAATPGMTADGQNVSPTSDARGE